MTSKIKFRKGDRVEMTDLALRLGLQRKKNRKTGIVIEADACMYPVVRIKRDGDRQSEKWNKDFWRKV